MSGDVSAFMCFIFSKSYWNLNLNSLLLFCFEEHMALLLSKTISSTGHEDIIPLMLLKILLLKFLYAPLVTCIILINTQTSSMN